MVVDMNITFETTHGAVAPLDAASAYRLADAPLLHPDQFEPVLKILMGLTHAFSNLIMPVREYPTLMLRQVPDDSPQRMFIEAIQTAANRIGEINENLIQLCHGNEGSAMQVDLGSLALQVMDGLVSDSGGDPVISFTLHLASEPVLVEGQPDALALALRHLCRNATQFMPDGGDVTVEVGTQTIAAEDFFNGLGISAGHYAMVRIRDTGTGVEEHYRDTLFQPFVTSIRGEGRGLGLSFAYRTALHHRGHILYRPDVQPGAEFVLLLPA
jgi:signal transduction histidine kinase